MFLQSLKLNQFRCFESLRLEFGEGDVHPGTSIFVGDNAQGKTSILEAICALLRLQSPRTNSLSDCVLFGQTGLAVSGHLGDTELRLRVTPSGRRLFLDGETAKTADYLRASGLVVWMANDDLALVRGGGEGRRRFLDFMAGQLYPSYRPALKTYEKALRSRNYLMKRDASPRWPEIDAYTKILSEQATILNTHRREMIADLQPHAAAAQRQISGRPDDDVREALTLSYDCGTAGENLAEELHARRDEEFRRRATIAGPHRDDLGLALDGMPAAKFGSEGQQRTLALALKLAQSRLFLEKRERPPILLIDDVFGELDAGRRNALMTAWPRDSQTLITTTNLDWLAPGAFDHTRVWNVTEGTVAPA